MGAVWAVLQLSLHISLFAGLIFHTSATTDASTAPNAMKEIVGGVVSIITLIEATGVLADVSRNLVLRWKNAPHEIQVLATRLSILSTELQSIRNATANSHPVLTDAIICQSLSDLLTDTRNRLAKLESLHCHLHKHRPTRQKVQWALKDAAKVDKMLSKALEVEQRLANLMALISMRAQTPILHGLDKIEQMVSTLIIRSAASPATNAPSLLTSLTPQSIESAANSSQTSRVLATTPWQLDESWRCWGFCGSIISTSKGQNTDYHLSFTISLPLARILGRYVLLATMSLRSAPLLRNAFTLRHPSYFAVARVVGENHPFIQACRTNDLATVRSMLLSGEGRPTDKASGVRSPMFYAVNNDSLEVAIELLDSGIEIDAEINPWLSNALIVACSSKSLDIVRLLLRRGASPDYIDVVGRSPAMSCWDESDDKTRCSSLDVINLLRQSVDLELRACDKFGRAALHYAALHGANASQIATLISLGGDIHQVENMGMKPIHWAALGGNDLALIALGPHYDQCTVDDGLLQVTLIGKAFFKDSGIRSDLRLEYQRAIEVLLQCGADPQAQAQLSREFLGLYTKSEIQNEISGRALTASELSAAYGPISEAWYLSVLEQSGFLDDREGLDRLDKLKEAGYAFDEYVSEREVSVGLDEDQFWDAEESL